MLMIMLMMTGLKVKMVLMIMRLVRLASFFHVHIKGVLYHSRDIENHQAYGKCKLRKEKFTLEGKAELLYVQKLAEGTSL